MKKRKKNPQGMATDRRRGSLGTLGEAGPTQDWRSLLGSAAPVATTHQEGRSSMSGRPQLAGDVAPRIYSKRRQHTSTPPPAGRQGSRPRAAHYIHALHWRIYQSWVDLALLAVMPVRCYVFYDAFELRLDGWLGKESKLRFVWMACRLSCVRKM
jgi:hypothetical protein